MNPNIAANQQRLFLEFFAELRPHLRRDSALPRRIKEILARHRAIGSRDRKLYRELLFTAVRFLPWVEPYLDDSPATAAKITAWLAPELKPTTHYRAALCGDWPAVPDSLSDKGAVLTRRLPTAPKPADGASVGNAQRTAPHSEPSSFSLHPSTLLPGERPGRAPTLPQQTTGHFSPEALLPGWFHEHCPAAFASPHLEAINSRAGVWIRLQCNDRDLVLDEFRAKGWTFSRNGDFPDAVCLPPNAEVADTDAYRRGFLEIQDLGSQLVLATASVPPGGRWLDACAGAGGKTLQLARLLGSGGQVDATDIRPEILEELRDRAQRARLANVRITNIADGAYDGVLVDAPCSGSGTWRRQPHLKWCVKPEAIASFTATQLDILITQAPRVRPGGLLVYATCSLSHHENHDVVAAFLRDHPQFAPVTPARGFGGEFDGLGTSLLPGTHDTDGFYMATLRRA